MLLFLSTIGNLLGRGLKLLYNTFCTCSGNQESNMFANMDTNHEHHHLHDNYKVHHIAMNNINANDLHLMSSCNMTNIDNNLSKATPKVYTQLNSIQAYPTYEHSHPCVCEMDNDAKMSNDSMVDQFQYTEKYRHYTEHNHNCNCSNDTELSTLFKESPKMLPNIYAPESIQENIPFYFCIFLIIIYIIGGSIMLHIWNDLSILDGAYFCFVTLR